VVFAFGHRAFIELATCVEANFQQLVILVVALAFESQIELTFPLEQLLSPLRLTCHHSVPQKVLHAELSFEELRGLVIGLRLDRNFQVLICKAQVVLNHDLI
jgi:hypothetical protein